MVRIDHRLVLTRCSLDSAHHGEIVLDAKTELYLVCGEALGDMPLRFLREARGFAAPFDAIEAGGVRLHAIPEHAAEKARHRLAPRLAGDVPEGDIERADAADHRAFLPVVACMVVHAVP